MQSLVQAVATFAARRLVEDLSRIVRSSPRMLMLADGATFTLSDAINDRCSNADVAAGSRQHFKATAMTTARIR